MVSESLACPACHEALPPGRLSCPHCGTVLAAVARDFRAGAPSAAAISASSWLDASPGTATTGSVTLAESPDADLQPVAPTSSRADASSFADTPRAAPAPTFVDPAAPFDEDAPLAAEALPATDGPPARIAPHFRDAAPPAEVPPANDDATWVARPADEPPRPADEPPPPADEPTPLAEARPTPVAAYLAALAVPPAPDPVAPPAAPLAGAWVPPAQPEVVDRVDAPAPPATATRSVGDVLRPVDPDVANPPARILPRAWDPSAAAAGVGASADASSAVPGGRRFVWPEVNRERIDDAAGLVVLAGAMGAAVGFLLPWSWIVIGSRSSGGYFDTWGLAAPSHLVVFGLVLVALALAALPNRIDTWVRTGVVGIALGSLLLGLAWPYAFGPLGAGLGVVLVVVSAFALLAGGLLSTLVQRHSEPPPAV